MQFLNPYEFLEVENPDFNELKKAKKRKLTEFELSDDGHLVFKGKTIQKSDFLQAVDSLDNPENNQFYWALTNIPMLNDFLSTGTEAFFDTPPTARICSNPKFIEFISPFFAYQYDKVLHKAYKTQNLGLLKKMAGTPLLVNTHFSEKAYETLRLHFTKIFNELQQLREEIDAEESDFTEKTATNILPTFQKEILPLAVNALPAYFQTQRNELAQKFRNLAVAVFNGLANAEAALAIIEFGLRFEIAENLKQKFVADRNELAEIHKNRAEKEKYAPKLVKYALFVSEMQKLLKNVAADADTKGLLQKINQLLDIPTLNSEPDFFEDIRTHIALCLRALSVEVFNEHSDMQTAQALIRLAQSVQIKEVDAILNIARAARDLEKIVREKKDEEIAFLNILIQKAEHMLEQLRSNHRWSINQSGLKKIIDEFFPEPVLTLAGEINQPTLKKQLLDALVEIFNYSDYEYSLVKRLDALGYKTERERLERIREEEAKKKREEERKTAAQKANDDLNKVVTDTLTDILTAAPKVKFVCSSADDLNKQQEAAQKAEADLMAQMRANLAADLAADLATQKAEAVVSQKKVADLAAQKAADLATQKAEADLAAQKAADLAAQKAADLAAQKAEKERIEREIAQNRAWLILMVIVIVLILISLLN